MVWPIQYRTTFPFKPSLAARLVLSTIFLSLLFATPIFASSLSEVSIHKIQDLEHQSDPFIASAAPQLAPDLFRQYGAVGSNPDLARHVLGFAPYWELSTLKFYNFSYISEVAYFGVDIDGNSGNLITNNQGWSGWSSADLQSMTTRAHSYGAKVLLTVKEFDTLNSGGTQTLGGFLASSSSQQTAINQIISQVQAKNADGVNVDFEPTDSSSATSIQKSQFATFLTNLTTQLRAQISSAEVIVDTTACAARGSSPCATNSFFDPAALASTPIDAMMVMAYDFYSPSSSIIAPVSPLHGYPGTYWYDVATSLQDYLNKAPVSKVLLGIPYYGLKMSTSSSNPNASSLGHGSNPTYDQTLSDISCTDAAYYRDDIGHVARAIWFSDSSKSSCGTIYNQWRQTYYDDQAALNDKYDLVNNKNLRGIGIWALGYDGSHYQDLTTPIQSHFNDAAVFLSSVSLSNVSFAHTHLYSGDVLTVSATITNNSQVTIPAATPSSGYTYNEGDSNTFAPGGIIRLGLDYDGRTGPDHPYRWGLSAPLPPGQSATITGSVRLSSIKNTTYYVGLVDEQVGWITAHTGDTSIDVTYPDVQITSATFTPSAIAPGNNVRVNVTVKNNGPAILRPSSNQTSSYLEGQTTLPSTKGDYRVGIDYSGRTQSLDHPYRFGLTSNLNPGSSATISGYLTLNNVKNTSYWVGGVVEGIEWLENNVGTDSINVAYPSATLSAVNFSPSVAQSDYEDFSATLTNSGPVTIPAATPNSSYQYPAFDQAPIAPYGTLRVGVDFDNRFQSLNYPYRWGLATPLDPGDATTVTGKFKVPYVGQRNFWAGLVSEGSSWLQQNLGSTSVTIAPSLDITNVSYQSTTISSGSVLAISVTVKNNTTHTIKAATPSSGYIYNEGDTAPSANAEDFRIGLDYTGHTQSLDHPYRWGLSSDLAAGQSQVINAKVKLITRGTKNFWLGTLQEGVTWIEDNKNQTSVTVN